MIPRLYLEDETNFNHNGIGALTESLSAVVVEEANGIFTLEIRYPISGRWFSEITKLRLIKALTNLGEEEHIFRIDDIVKSSDDKMVTILASSKSNELAGHIFTDFKDTGPASQIMTRMKSKITPPTTYNFVSDMNTEIKVEWFMRNVLNSILGQEGSMVDKLGGGELRRTNNTIYLYRRRGNENVARVSETKNLRGLTITESTKGLITRIQPYIRLQETNSKNETVEKVIIGDIVSSPLVNKYPLQIVVPVDFGEYEFTNKADLDAKAKTYFTSMNPDSDKPKTELEIDLLQISDSSEYARFKHFEKIKLFDTVTVYAPRYGVDTLVKIVRVEFDVLREKVISLKAGQPKSSYSQALEKSYANKIDDKLSGINDKINTVQMSADGKNKVFTGPNEPDISVSSEGDTWFKVLGNGEMEMYIFDGAYWQVVINANTSKEILDKIDQAETDIAQNILDIDAALDKATQAELDAGFSKDLAEEAKSLGVTASSLASEAKTNANKAMTDAQEAIRQAGITGGVAADASADATEAKRLAGLAEGNAQEALTKANASVTDASKALTDATKAFNKSFKSSTIAYATSTNGSTPPSTGWGTTVPSPSPDVYIWTRTTILLNDNTPVVSYSVGKIGAKGDQGSKGDTGGQGIQGIPGVNAPTIKSVVQQFYLSTSKTTQTGGSWVSTVPVWSSGKYYWVRVVTTYSNDTTSTSTPVLDNALNDSLVTALEVKTANQNLSTTVTQHATLIAGKANSTTVDALTGRVTTAEGSISTIAGEVALKASKSDVNTLTGRVTTAEGTITAQAGQIALKANTTTVNALTGRVSAAESALTVQSGKIDLAATKTELTTAIDGIEIGGRNLLIGSSEEEKEYITNTNTVTAVRGLTSDTMWFEKNKEYTFSFEMKSEEGITRANYNYLWASSPDTGNNTSIGPINDIIDDGEWHRYSLTFSFPSDRHGYVAIRFDSRTSEVMANVPFSIRRAQLEKGNKATDWTPAPEDVDKAISTVQANLTVEAGKIASKVSQTDFDALNGRVGTAESTITQNTTAINLRATKTDVNTLTGRVTTAEGNITTQAGLIALKANQSTVDTLTGRVSTTEAKITATDGKVTTLTTKTDGNTTSIGKLQTSYTGLSSTVATVKQDLDGLEIGGRNLLEGTATQLTLQGARRLYSDLVIGQTYTFQAEYEIVSGTPTSFLLYLNNDSANQWEDVKISDRPKGRIEHVFTPKSTNAVPYLHLYSGKDAAESLTSRVIFSRMKLEKGNKATDWSPAPEDMATVTQFSSLEQTVNGIQTKVANKAEQTQVTQLAGQWQTTTNLVNGHTSQISSLGTQVNLRATKAEVEGSLGAVNLITNGGNIQSTAGWYGPVILAKHAYYKNNTANLLLLATDGTTEISAISEYFNIEPNTEYTITFYGFASSNVKSMDLHFLSRKHTSSNTFDNTRVLVTTKLSPGHLDNRSVTFTTNATDNQACIRFDNNGSTNGINSGVYIVDITLVKGSVAPSAWFESTSDSIVSQINISPESILLSSKKIQIKGDTYIESGVIKNSHIDTLVADKITAGTLNAANVNIINLNVANLTGNRTQFVESAWNSINGNLRVNSESLSYMYTDGSYLWLSKEGISYWQGATSYYTNFLTDVFVVTGLNHDFESGPLWYQLPPIYRGKQFKCSVVLTDAYGIVTAPDYSSLAINRIVCTIDRPNIDYAGGWIPIIGYSRSINIKTGALKYHPIQVTLIVQY